MQSTPAALPAQSTDRSGWLSIAQLIVSALGLVLSILGAFVLAALALIAKFGEATPVDKIIVFFSMSWISLLVAALAVPSLVFSIRRLSGQAAPALQGGWVSSPFRLASLLLMLWPLFLAAGTFISGQAQLAWLLLPPLQILAIGIPIWWLVELGRHNLPACSPQRSWGLLNLSIFMTTPAVMVLEIVVILFLGVLFALWASAQPGLIAQLQQLGERIVNSQGDVESMLRLLRPYLSSPWVILGTLAILSGVAPLMEELLKPLGVWFLAGRKLTPAAGFAAGAICGGTFALIESLLYLSNPGAQGWVVLVIGRTGTALLHITGSALVGEGLAIAWQDGKYLQLVWRYLLAVALHGLWNGFSILSGFGAVISGVSGGVGWLVATVALAIAIFVILWSSNHRLQTITASQAITAAQRGALPAKETPSEMAGPHDPLAQ
ncbi:MAG TPA: PrsW family glutamic-type intramembrane protease [Anaerolineaceae bacterium]